MQCKRYRLCGRQAEPGATVCAGCRGLLRWYKTDARRRTIKKRRRGAARGEGER